ncbi:MAG: glycosyltransferase family 4 protein [Thermodesulfobacteriota bacterium]
MSLRLGFHYHVPALSLNGQIFLPGYLGRFIDSLATHCEEVVCFLHAPLPGEHVLIDYPVRSAKVSLIDIGPHVSVPRRLLSSRQVASKIRNECQGLDVMLIRGPTPLMATIAQAVEGVPVALLLVGDYLAGVNDLPQPYWRKEAVRLWAWWNYRQQLRLARRSLTLVNSRLLYEQLQPLVPELHEVRTTTLTSNDFFIREDTCQTPPYHLLYTGRMDRAKGLFEMVEAIALLVSQGEDVILDLVGWPAENDSIMTELANLAQARGVSEQVIYHGYKQVGPELFAYYKQGDVFVIASRSSFEGFPRSIWEAMAHSLPVVATRVGSIPYFLGGAVEFIEQNDGNCLAASIRKILHDQARRRHLIQAGSRMARENTLEVQGEKLIGIINRWLDKKHGKNSQACKA